MAERSEAPMFGLKCPWGAPERWETVGRGVWYVVTASHGGLYLEPWAESWVLERFGRSPWLDSGQWWEEDVDAGVAMWVLRDFLFPAYRDSLQPVNPSSEARLREYIERRMGSGAWERFERFLEREGASDA